MSLAEKPVIGSQQRIHSESLRKSQVQCVESSIAHRVEKARSRCDLRIRNDGLHGETQHIERVCSSSKVSIIPNFRFEDRTCDPLNTPGFHEKEDVPDGLHLQSNSRLTRVVRKAA